MKGGLVPEHYMVQLTRDEGDRLRELLQEVRDVDRIANVQYRLNLNEAEDELLEGLVKRLTPPEA